MDKSSFRMVFGDSPVIKVLDFLLDIVKAPNIRTKKSAFTIQLRRYKCSKINRLSYNREFDYSLTDIAKGADVGWSTLHQFFGEFVRLGIVKKTRRIGRAELYKLDEENSLVKYFSFPPVLSEAMTGGSRYRAVENCNSPSDRPERSEHAIRSIDRWWSVAVDKLAEIDMEVSKMVVTKEIILE